MPYRTTYRKPEVFLRRLGVVVYRTYRDDDFDQGPMDFWYTLDPRGSSEDPGAFDVRDLPTWREPPHPPFLTGANDTAANRRAWDRYHATGVEEKAARKAVLDAIDAGIIAAGAVLAP